MLHPPSSHKQMALTAEDMNEVLECARYNELEDMVSLLDAGVDVDYRRPEDGTTALHMACANGHVEIAGALLQRGARHLANAAGNTPLHWACLNGKAEVAALLLEKCKAGEVDVYLKNGQGKSAFTVAISGGHEDLARSLLHHASAEPPAAGGGGEAMAGGGGEKREEEGEEEVELDEEDEGDLFDKGEGGGGGGGVAGGEGAMGEGMSGDIMEEK